MFSLPDAARHFGLTLYAPHSCEPSKGASIDTRTLRPGDCFFALTGTQADGHLFLEKAFSLGASGAVISDAYYREHLQGRPFPSGFKNILTVENPSVFLAELAAWHRSRFSIPFVGVTGSVGKTSTKEFLSYLLASQAGAEGVLATRGNLNNHLGLPLTLLELNGAHRYCVAEIGANAAGDIAYLCRILKPTAGIVTCVAPVHLEGFGSLKTIYQTKTDLFRAIPPGAPAVTTAGDPEMDAIADALPVKVFRAGTDRSCQGMISDVCVDGEKVSFLYRGLYRFSFPGVAAFLAVNAAMALLMVESLGLPLDRLPAHWEGFKLPDGRFSIKTIAGGIRVIHDGYNASPKSFEKALETFSSLACKGKKILVFSDMRELGESSRDFHRALGVKIASSGLDAVYAYGSESLSAIDAVLPVMPQARHFSGPEDLAAHLAGTLQPDDVILLKASRGMKIERVIEELQRNERFSPAAGA